MAEKTTKELERIYTIPLRDVKSSPRNHRTDRAVRAVKSYLQRHMKAQEVWIDTTVNEKLWERGMYKLASKIRVRALKFDDGVVEVTLPEADVTTSRREEIAKKREAREDEKAKKEEKAEAKEGEAAKPETAKPAEGTAPEAPKPASDAKPEPAKKPAETKPAPSKPAAAKATEAAPAKPKPTAKDAPAKKESPKPKKE